MNITHMTDFTREECINCGVPFYMPTTTRTHKKENKETFYCPNGHSMVYKKSAADILKEQMVQKDREISQLNQKLRDCSKPKRGRPKKLI